MEIGYWGVKGATEPIRYLLAYLGVKYTEKNPATPEEWFGKTKQTIGLEFPNLPYLIDGDFKTSETSAIALYISEKHNPTLFGRPGVDRVRH
jgi:glutathione S-transferase